MNETKPLASQVLKKLAKLGNEYKIKGKSFERNSLLKPLDIAFDQIRKHNQSSDPEFLRAISTEEIFKHIDRISGENYKPGDTKYQKIGEFVNVIYKDLLEDVYNGRMPVLLNDEKSIKSAYLFYLRNERITKGEN